MCGIFGYAETRGIYDKEFLIKALDTISHRGPDQDGHFINKNRNLFLGHKRLSIHDLSDAGIQPMHSGHGTIVFNGEIYNYKEIKRTLEQQFSISWKGTSDTEILLEAIARFGIEKTLPMLNGMFAFAYYCSEKDEIYVARDRFGEKPLYFYFDNSKFVFSSELRPLEKVCSGLTLNDSAISSLISNSYIPAPASIYNEVKKLRAAHYITIKISDDVRVSEEVCYWHYLDAVESARQDQHKSLEESLLDIEDKLEQSVKLRMDSDVPFGAFLSGGIDSTCIVSLMQRISSKPIDTFSIGFYEEEYNEACHAKKVAKVLGTNHHELYLTPKDVIDRVSDLPLVYDEPFADSSQLPTLIVSEFARKNVTVALSGDSGDELFAGYNRHQLAQSLEQVIGSSLAGRKALSKLIQSISPTRLDKLFGLVRPIVGKKVDRIGDKLHKLSKLLCASDEVDLYQRLIETSNRSSVMRSGAAAINTLDTEIFGNASLSLSEKIMLQDTQGYMQHDILTKVDRAAMHCSLETRVPFLDNEVFEAAWRTPIEYKLFNKKTKYPLRQIISKYVPNELIERPKAGFGVPINHWLRGELKEWAGDLLSETSLRRAGVFNEQVVLDAWNEHVSGAKNNQYELWNILMFLQWLEVRK